MRRIFLPTAGTLRLQQRGLLRWFTLHAAARFALPHPFRLSQFDWPVCAISYISYSRFTPGTPAQSGYAFETAEILRYVR
ncbi:hypothetical protein TPL01_23910 [Sulfuriferula plumbiphila]|uniref:Uncharacterized protein n=1 Tax=Sulfuriferula plumbiphila TaxID=171865 RepID=A0A512L9U4_9PROT|nr:hypothetical protein SFPGR_26800 [Sulfuriferula plumbiphila]GEP31253.1 hypothetical protein TPL01_23910 [Sulfuriferula plumbiphila]